MVKIIFIFFSLFLFSLASANDFPYSNLVSLQKKSNTKVIKSNRYSRTKRRSKVTKKSVPQSKVKTTKNLSPKQKPKLKPKLKNSRFKNRSVPPIRKRPFRKRTNRRNRFSKRIIRSNMIDFASEVQKCVNSYVTTQKFNIPLLDHKKKYGNCLTCRWNLLKGNNNRSRGTKIKAIRDCKI